MKRGFTLIELLVVVLIIGILSAIALPQYTKAVEKSRAAEAMQILKSLRDAQALCILEHGMNGGECGGDDPMALFDNGPIEIPGEEADSIGLDGGGIQSKYFIYGLVSNGGMLVCAERTNDGAHLEYQICTSADPRSSTVKAYNQFSCSDANMTICSSLGFKKSGDHWIM